MSVFSAAMQLRMMTNWSVRMCDCNCCAHGKPAWFIYNGDGNRVSHSLASIKEALKEMELEIKNGSMAASERERLTAQIRASGLPQE